MKFFSYQIKPPSPEVLEFQDSPANSVNHYKNVTHVCTTQGFQFSLVVINYKPNFTELASNYSFLKERNMVLSINQQTWTRSYKENIGVNLRYAKTQVRSLVKKNHKTKTSQ